MPPYPFNKGFCQIGLHRLRDIHGTPSSLIRLYISHAFIKRQRLRRLIIQIKTALFKPRKCLQAEFVILPTVRRWSANRRRSRIQHQHFSCPTAHPMKSRKSGFSSSNVVLFISARLVFYPGIALRQRIRCLSTFQVCCVSITYMLISPFLPQISVCNH